jgi:uncharacterized protein (DUF2236 family)
MAERTTPDMAVPLGPDSLTWRYFGDLRIAQLGTWVTAMQNMLPELGAGVIEHSAVTEEPLQRISRSLYPIMGVVYDGARAPDTARQIVGYHRTITGVCDGQKYHALDDETFYWAHATFFMQMLLTAELFIGRLSEEKKRQLYDEHVRWYAQYGKSMLPVPPTWHEFQRYWRATCEQKLQPHPAALQVLRIRPPKPDFVPLPRIVWDVLAGHFLDGQRWVATGCFDQTIRKRLGLRWEWTDEVILRLFALQVQLLFLVVPDEFRLHPRAKAAYKRIQGELPDDAPLPEPPKWAAPPHHHGGPQHHPVGDNSAPLSAWLPVEVMSMTMLSWAGALGKTARLADATVKLARALIPARRTKRL